MSKQNIIVRVYKKLSQDYLLVLQSMQAATLMGTGDLIAQTVIEKKQLKEVNFVRTGQFASLGAVFVGPLLGTWYHFLAKKIQPKGKFWGVKKMVVDQVCFPPCFFAAFLTILNTIEGHDWEFTKNQLRLKYPDVLMTNYTIWPAVQLVNFYFVPLTHQVLVVQSVALFWNTYMSWKSSLGKENLNKIVELEETVQDKKEQGSKEDENKEQEGKEVENKQQEIEIQKN